MLSMEVLQLEKPEHCPVLRLALSAAVCGAGGCSPPPCNSVPSKRLQSSAQTYRYVLP